MQDLIVQVKEFRLSLEGSRELWKVEEQIMDHIYAVQSSLCQQCAEEIDTLELQPWPGPRLWDTPELPCSSNSCGFSSFVSAVLQDTLSFSPELDTLVISIFQRGSMTLSEANS